MIEHELQKKSYLIISLDFELAWVAGCNPTRVARYRNNLLGARTAVLAILKLFAEYQKLHDYFGRGANDVMKRLKALKEAQHS